SSSSTARHCCSALSSCRSSSGSAAAGCSAPTPTARTPTPAPSPCWPTTSSGWRTARWCSGRWRWGRCCCCCCYGCSRACTAPCPEGPAAGCRARHSLRPVEPHRHGKHRERGGVRPEPPAPLAQLAVEAAGRDRGKEREHDDGTDQGRLLRGEARLVGGQQQD